MATAVAELDTEPQDEEAPKKRRMLAVPSLPALPEGLDEPAGVFGARLVLISLGKPVSNVSTTLTFALDIPDFDAELMGEHAYTLGFLNGWLGEGAIIKAAPLAADEENNVHQKLTIRLPRYLDGGRDQILLMIAPLLGGKKFVEPLLQQEWSWRLNVTTDIPGTLVLYPMQQKFDLTTKAE